MKILILGFYGVGKTTVLKDYPNAVDLTDVPKPEGFTKPTLDILLQYWNDDRYDIVMADPWWTNVLIKSGIPFYVVIPTVNRRDEFMKNFKVRKELGLGGGDAEFCNYVNMCWYGWLDFYRYKLPSVMCVVLKPGLWMKDALFYILKQQ